MAIGHLHATVVQRSAGQSAVSAAAYAARTRMVDVRTGVIYDYSRKQADVVFSFVGLPKGAPESLRDAAALSNAMEARETRKNSQTARKFIMALPDELTPQQREGLVKDFGRENFTRKGLAWHVAIHRPHAYGDQRNVHAHWTVATRVMENGVFTEKDRESNSKEALLAWRNNWEKLVNRQLERHGHAARISMQTLEAQGIDRAPQIHLGQGASALERKGQVTDRGSLLRDIANDNEESRAVGKEIEQEIAAEPEFVHRDAQEAQWQDEVENAGMAYAEEQRRQFLNTQGNDRAAFERNGEAMLARHAAAWSEMVQRHALETAAIYETATHSLRPFSEVGEAASSSASFLLSLFASWAESITRSVSGTARSPRRQRGRDKAKQERERRQAEQQKEAQARELEAVMQEQAREREQYDRRRAQMLFQQQGALAALDERMENKSSLQQAFDIHTETGDAYKARAVAAAERLSIREGRDRGEPGLEPS